MHKKEYYESLEMSLTYIFDDIVTMSDGDKGTSDMGNGEHGGDGGIFG